MYSDVEKVMKILPPLMWFQRYVKLKKIQDISSSKGNADVDEYMRGLANGVILAAAIMEDREPVYIEPPKEKTAANETAQTS